MDTQPHKHLVPGVSSEREHQILTSAQLAARENVSIRTAQRLRKKSYIPRDLVGYSGRLIPARTVGRDGKKYPSHHSVGTGPRVYPPTSRILDSLRHVRHHLHKADKVACESGVEARVLAAMQKIQILVLEIAARWKEAHS